MLKVMGHIMDRLNPTHNKLHTKTRFSNSKISGSQSIWVGRKKESPRSSKGSILDSRRLTLRTTTKLNSHHLYLMFLVFRCYSSLMRGSEPNYLGRTIETCSIIWSTLIILWKIKRTWLAPHRTRGKCNHLGKSHRFRYRLSSSRRIIT